MGSSEVSILWLLSEIIGCEDAPPCVFIKESAAVLSMVFHVIIFVAASLLCMIPRMLWLSHDSCKVERTEVYTQCPTISLSTIVYDIRIPSILNYCRELSQV